MNFFYKHRNWMVAVVAIMLFCMVIYVLTLDDGIQPGAPNGVVDPVPADAP